MRSGLWDVGSNDTGIGHFAPRFRLAASVGRWCLLTAPLAGVVTPQERASAPPGVQQTASSPLTLDVNIPAYRLDVRRDSLVIRSYVVAVGMRRYQTPIGTFHLSRIVWNPWWYPPDAPWAAKDTVTGPGPRNPMGKVKLQFNASYFAHGTPLVTSLVKATSHGCIRMHNDDAAELALLIQRSLDLNPPFVDTVTRDWKHTREVLLTTPVPMTVRYEHAEVRDSMLVMHPDVYRRSGTDNDIGTIMQALSRAGVDTLGISPDAISKLAQRARTMVVRVPIRSVWNTSR